MAVLPRYNRNVSALSEEECNLLSSKRVVVVGCGGLGGIVIEDLARIGVGHIRVIDGDVFEESNLNRQIIMTEADLGRKKAECAADRVRSINSLVEVEPVVAYLDRKNSGSHIRGFDCVVDCLDNLEGRFWLAHAANNLGIPIVYGAIAGWFGQVCTIFPGDESFPEIYGTLDNGTESQHKQLGNLPFTAHSIAAIQAAECVKVLLGRGDCIRNRLLMVDLFGGTAEELPIGPEK